MIKLIKRALRKTKVTPKIVTPPHWVDAILLDILNDPAKHHLVEPTGWTGIYEGRMCKLSIRLPENKYGAIRCVVYECGAVTLVKWPPESYGGTSPRGWFPKANQLSHNYWDKFKPLATHINRETSLWKGLSKPSYFNEDGYPVYPKPPVYY